MLLFLLSSMRLNVHSTLEELQKNFIIIFDKILSNNIIKIQGEFMKIDDSGAHNECSLTFSLLT